MRVRDLLEERGGELVTCWPHERIAKASKLLRENDIGILPVVEDRNLVGVLSERDIARAVGRPGVDLGELRVRDLMTVDVVTCRPEDPLKSAAELMDGRKVRHLPVISGGRELVGVISLRDVLHGLLTTYREEAAVLREREMLDHLRHGTPDE